MEMEAIIFMRLDFHNRRRRADLKQPRGGAAFTLPEVMVSVVIVALVFGAIINGYLSGATESQWSGYYLAAQSASNEGLEKAHSAVWDIALQKNEVANLSLTGYASNSTALGGYIITGYTTNILDIPWKGTNYVIATNFYTITLFPENNYSNLPVQLQLIRVDTVWPFSDWGKFSVMYYTNTTCTYIAPDNRDPSTLGGS
jgi:prepilin-type N-terminal cleavage/methylation domain-containing protein